MRRHDLDWLRVLVFMLLIFYHVGMFFVPWEFHIKNNITYKWLIYPMWFVNQWRLPILFVISGMGTHYALQKRSGSQFTLERLKRLLVPLAFGILLVIPPQVYIERIVKNQFTGSYLEFWPLNSFIGIYPYGNFSWHHLWFLPYLLIFSLVLIPAFLYLKTHPTNNFSTWIKQVVKNPVTLYMFIIPLYLTEAFMKPYFPVTHDLVNDWYTFSSSILLFFYGFLLITTKDVFWKTVENYRKLFLIIGITSFTGMLLAASGFRGYNNMHYMEAFLKVISLWSWILSLFGFASKYLNKGSKLLSYANEAVYPFYILHQTVMIVIAWYLIDLNWSLGMKAFVMIIGTFGLSWFFYEFLIRRWKYVRPLFGLKNNKKKDDAKVFSLEAIPIRWLKLNSK